jgi:hypothetical protein
MLDRVAKTCGLEWDWGQGGERSFDDTGYAVSRDFALLQREHAAFLKVLMESSLERGHEGGAYCLPWGLGLEDSGLACPLGIKPGSWRLAIVEAGGETRLRLASEFFPWWGRDIDAGFFENMLRCLLWQHVQWRSPVNAQESQTLRSIEEAAGRVKALAGKVPADLREALRELDSAVSSNVAPAPSGIGYRRRAVIYELFDNWHITLPGTLVEQFAEDGEVAHYAGPNLSLRISAITAVGPNGKAIWPETVAEAGEVDAHGLLRRVAAPEPDGKFVSQFAVVLREQADKLRILMLTLTVATAAELSVFDTWLDSIRHNDDDTSRVGRD